MNKTKLQPRRLGIRGIRAMAVAGATAFVGLGVLSLSYGHDDDSGRVDLAGSGDAPADTVYVQPTEKAMDLGATATWTTPSGSAPTSKAVPPLGMG